MYLPRLAISALSVVASLAAASPATAASSDWPVPGSQPADVILMTPGADPASVSLYVDVVCHDED